MQSTLEALVIGREIEKQHDAFAVAAADPNVSDEQLSAMMGRNNQELLRLMETIPPIVNQLADEAERQALATGMRLFNAAVPHTNPEYVTDLMAGVNVMAKRAREGAMQGAPLPMHYMDMDVRKMIFLAESGLPHIKLEEESEESK